MPEYKHWSLNPTLFNPQEPELVFACRTMEKDGFRLIQVVPYSQYLAIAVFERPDELIVTIEERLSEPKPIQVCYVCNGEYVAALGHDCTEEWKGENVS